MSSGAARLLSAAEDLLQKTLAAGHLFSSSLLAPWWLHDKHDLKGRVCHCPRGLPRHLVHSEGVREAADVVIDFGSNVRCPQRLQIPVPHLAAIAGEIGDGDIVHVKADLIGEFVTHLFPKIAGPIVLVTGDSDFSPVSTHAHLLQSTKIIHWFAQNCDVPYRHPKLTRIPVGIDNPRYTKLEKRIGFLIEMAFGKSPLDPTATRNDMGDQLRLQDIASRLSNHISSKPLKALCTFHMNQKLVPNFDEVPDRVEAFEQLQHNPHCFFVPRRLRQDECWKIHGQFAFEVSPRGKGLDCFRTWESLFLGTIPIVKTTTLDPLYIDEDLPVVIVDSFREICAANLARWKAKHEHRFTPDLITRLCNDYWVARMRASAAPFRPIIDPRGHRHGVTRDGGVVSGL